MKIHLHKRQKRNINRGGTEFAEIGVFFLQESFTFALSASLRCRIRMLIFIRGTENAEKGEF
jgi:hypothetical protein